MEPKRAQRGMQARRAMPHMKKYVPTSFGVNSWLRGGGGRRPSVDHILDSLTNRSEVVGV